MTAQHFLVAHWPGERTARVCSAALYREAQEFARAWGVVAAFSKAHAAQLYRDGAWAIRGTDGRLERCGVVEHGGNRHA